ncbi:MAG: methylmalonyl Co-A mutase-associated GTPase MeaB [Aestuariibaculum sp.]
MARKRKTSLNERQGVSEIPEITNCNSISNFKQKRQDFPDTNTLVTAILKRDIAVLSRAITLIESENPIHAEKANILLNACLPYANKAIRIGITGIPGVGKSTFIEVFGTYLIQKGHNIAVLAIDPSSSVSKGSILGDKTRMESLSTNPKAYIRPSASGATLGGVARKTREAILLCEASGFDIILIETVGVGQSEIALHGMVDFFLLLQLSRMGDELQGIKRGIIEMAHAIAINKADGDNMQAAKQTRTELQKALQYYPKSPSGVVPEVLLCSALNEEGIATVWEVIGRYIEKTKQNGFFNANRNEQNQFWFKQTITERLKASFFNNPKIKEALQEQQELIAANKTTPFAAAEFLLKL